MQSALHALQGYAFS